MAVYVDWLLKTLPSRTWPYSHACHLTADTLDELHVFAACLGLRPEWFQSRSTLPHYDLTAGKRRKAVELGAVEILVGADWRAMAARIEKLPISAEKGQRCG